MIVFLTGRRKVIPTNAEIRSEFCGYLPGVVDVERPGILARVPSANRAAIHRTTSNRPEQEICYGGAAVEAGYGRGRATKKIVTGFIRVLVNIALDVSPIEPKSDRMMPECFVGCVVQVPSRARGDVPSRNSRAVRNLIKGIERKLRQ